MAVPLQSSLFRSVVEPIINKVFDGIFKQRTPEWSQALTQITGTPRSYHEEPVLYGFGAAPELPDGQAVTYGLGGTNFVKRYPYYVYGLAFAITKVLAEDGDHIRIGKTYGEHLGQSMIETKELLVREPAQSCLQRRVCGWGWRVAGESGAPDPGRRFVLEPARDRRGAVADLAGAGAHSGALRDR